MGHVGRVAASSFTCLLVLGCASGQLNYNTLDVAGTIDDLLTSQVIYNLARFLDNPSGNPAQVSIGSGSVTTTNGASLTLAAPLTTAVTATSTAATAAGAILPAITRSTSGLAGAFSLTPGATNQASQNWALTTDTDSDQERRLRALYRYATRATSLKHLCKEYALIATSPAMSQPTPGEQAVTVPVLDGQFLREPGCVICSITANSNSIYEKPQSGRFCPRSADMYVNPRLTRDWLVPIRGELGPRQIDGLAYIGRYGDWTLYTQNPEQYHQFLLFILEATNVGSSAGQSGKTGAPKALMGTLPAQPTFVLPPGM
jgi:hypothetical protein